MVVDVAADLRSNVWMSTQTIAFSLNAIYLFTQNNNVDDAYAFKYNWNGSWSDKLIPEKPIFETKLDVDKSDTFKFENIGNMDVFCICNNFWRTCTWRDNLGAEKFKVICNL